MTQQLHREASECSHVYPEHSCAGGDDVVQEERDQRRSFFERQQRFVSHLCHLSGALREQPRAGGSRDAMLRARLVELAEGLPDGVYVPFGGGGERSRIVCALPLSAAFCLSTYERAPYVVCIESIGMPHNQGETYMAVRGGQLVAASLERSGCGGMLPKARPPQDAVLVERPRGSLADALPLSPCEGQGGEEEGVEEGGGTEKAEAEEAVEREVGVLQRAFGEAWKDRVAKIRAKSGFGKHPDWQLQALIVKAMDDLRQEQFAMQLIAEFKDVWEEEGVPMHVTTYGILAASFDAGLIEVVPDSVSISSLRRKVPEHPTLASFFGAAFGPPESKSFSAAQDSFVRSMAAYSVICYVLQIKDRHDGNILLLRDGSIVHIDYGYMLGRRMNGVVEIESAPFKLTSDWVEVMGGQTGAAYQQFLALCVRGYFAARKHSKRFVSLARSMQIGSTLPCLEGGERVLQQLQERLGLSLSDRECVDLFVRLRDEALRSWRTGAYDMLQRALGTA